MGVTLYRGDDSFINDISGKIVEAAKTYEKDTGIKVVLDEVDGRGDQNQQTARWTGSFPWV